MDIIRIGPHTILAGVEWFASQAATQKEAIEEALLHDSEKKYGIVLEGIEAFAVGTSSKPEKSIIGAAWLADSQKNDGDFILIEPLKEDKYWLCAIKNGIPFYGSDLVGSAQTIEQEAKTLLMSGEFRLITPDEHFGQMLGALATSYTAAGFEATVKGKGNFRFKPLNNKKLILIVVASILVSISLYFIWDMYDEHIKHENFLKLNKLEQQRKQQQEKQAYINAQNEFNATKDKLINEQLTTIQKILTTQGGLDATSIWAGVVNGLHTKTAGWNYAKAICNNEKCSFLLEPQNGATNKDLFKFFPSASLDEKGNAEINIPIKWPSNTVNVDKLRTKGQFIVDGISQFQSLQWFGFPVKWTPLTDITVSVPIPQVLQNAQNAQNAQNTSPVNPVKTVENISIGLLKGTFQIDGVSLWALDGISKYLASEEIVYEKLTMIFDTSTPGLIKSWSLEGSYYAKQ